MTTEERDDELRGAFRSVRERFDGASADPEQALRRVLLQTRERERKRKVSRFVFLPIAAALAASTAWAGVTHRLVPAADVVKEWLGRGEHPAPTSSGLRAPVHAAAAPSPPAIEEPAPSPPVVVAEEPPPPAPVRETHPAPSVIAPREPKVHDPAPIAMAPEPPAAPPLEAPTPAPSPRASDPTASDPNAALFAEANRAHFTEKDPVRALAAWDRYLAAAPQGRFAPEAHYNRALTLIRLGRKSEARTELEAFANGTYGNYRRDEARALLEALTRDAAP